MNLAQNACYLEAILFNLDFEWNPPLPGRGFDRHVAPRKLGQVGGFSSLGVCVCVMGWGGEGGPFFNT